MTRHVVFGTGQVGRHVVEQLVAAAIDVIAVNRSGRGDLPGADGRRRRRHRPRPSPPGSPPAPTSSTSASTPPTTTAGPRSSRRCSAACSPGPQAAGARLVVLDNLYAYGPTDGRDLVETLPARPTSAKAATRAAMTDRAARRPPRRPRRGRHRPGVGLLRPGRHPLGARRDRLRHRADRPHARR